MCDISMDEYHRSIPVSLTGWRGRTTGLERLGVFGERQAMVILQTQTHCWEVFEALRCIYGLLKACMYVLMWAATICLTQNISGRVSSEILCPTPSCYNIRKLIVTQSFVCNYYSHQFKSSMQLYICNNPLL